jgi:hypothetical protein
MNRVDYVYELHLWLAKESVPAERAHDVLLTDLHESIVYTQMLWILWNTL